MTAPLPSRTSRFLEHFKDQPGQHLICILRERIPGKMWTEEPDEYDSRTMTVDRDHLDHDLGGYLFHHYSAIGGLPVFEKIEGQR
jgi:hypothetical protein